MLLICSNESDAEGDTCTTAVEIYPYQLPTTLTGNTTEQDNSYSSCPLAYYNINRVSRGSSYSLACMITFKANILRLTFLPHTGYLQILVALNTTLILSFTFSQHAPETMPVDV